MSLVNIIFLIVGGASVAYLLFLIIRKFPQLVNLDASSQPAIKEEQVKQKILEEKLRREWSRGLSVVKEFVGFKRFSWSGLLKKWQDKLLQLEREYRRILNKDLSTQVEKSKARQELLQNARLYLDKEEFSKAEDLLIEVLNMEEHSTEAYYLLAQVYQGQKELEKSRETLEYLLTLTHNEDPKVYHSLAEISLARGNLKQAEEEYLRSISLDENNYLYYLQLAEVYKSMDQPNQALAMAKKSLVLAANNPKILDFLIEICIILRDKEQAVDYLDKLSDVNPDNKKIELWREQLEELGQAEKA